MPLNDEVRNANDEVKTSSFAIRNSQFTIRNGPIGRYAAELRPLWRWVERHPGLTTRTIRRRLNDEVDARLLVFATTGRLPVSARAIPTPNAVDVEWKLLYMELATWIHRDPSGRRWHVTTTQECVLCPRPLASSAEPM